MNNVRSPGQPGWAFLRATAADCIACVVWADGTHNQETPLKSPQAGEKWWPCIIIRGGTDLVPFYCPTLVWAYSRPWYVHASRLRRVRPEIPPPSVAHDEVEARPDAFLTSTVVIEELEESGDESDWECSGDDIIPCTDR